MSTEPLKQGPVLFVVDNCPICPKVAEQVALYLDERGYSLLVRKPGIGDLRTLAEYGFPALYLPKGFEGIDQDLVLVGADAPEHLKQVLV